MKRLAACLVLLLAVCLTADVASAQSRSRRARAQRQPDSGLRQVDTASYRLYTDMDEGHLAGVVGRLEAMAGEYRRRTAELSGRADDRRLPFYLYADLDAYHQAGGDKGTAGFFDGERLLAYIGERADTRAWSVIQHEAFHQYLAARLGHELPIWLNEGLAEYFAEAQYTGDAFLSGMAPPWRVKRLKEGIRSGSLPSLRELIAIQHENWNEAMRLDYYDLAWSVVHFLAHSEGGAGQRQLVSLIRISGRGGNALKQFEEQIGPVDVVQDAWERYWTQMSGQEMWNGFAEVAVQTVCSFYARALLAGEKPADVNELLAAARDGRLGGDTLPVTLLEDVTSWAKDLGEWTFTPTPDARQHVALRHEYGTMLARARVERGRVVEVVSWRAEPAGER